MDSGTGPVNWYQSIRFSDSVDYTYLMTLSTSRVMARLQRFPIIYSSVLSGYQVCMMSVGLVVGSVTDEVKVEW